MIWVEIIRKTIIKRKVDLPVTLIFFFNAIYIYLNGKVKFTDLVNLLLDYTLLHVYVQV